MGFLSFNDGKFRIETYVWNCRSYVLEMHRFRLIQRFASTER